MEGQKTEDKRQRLEDFGLARHFRGGGPATPRDSLRQVSRQAEQCLGWNQCVKVTAAADTL